MTSDTLLQVGLRRLNVDVRRGDGTLPPLLLLNGIGAPLQLLQPFVDALDPRREVIRVDVPGVGGSPKPVVPYSMGTLSFSIARVLDQLGHDRVDVMGFSWGGALAQHFALQHSGRVRNLVLACTGTGVLSVPGNPKVLRHMATGRRHRDPEYARSVASELYGGSLRDEPTSALSLLEPGPRRRSRRGYYYQLLAGSVWSSLGWLPLLRARTLVIAGDDDPIIPVINPKVMAKLIPNAELHLFPGGHLGLLTEASTLAPFVERFLQG
jgi:poly(3-hydroxyalkanoate) depolymerase